MIIQTLYNVYYKGKGNEAADKALARVICKDWQ